MAPKRTRGGAAKASSSRAEQAQPRLETAAPTASEDTTNAAPTVSQSRAAGPGASATAAPAESGTMAAPSVASPAARGRKNLTPKVTVRRSKEVRDANIASEAAKEAERDRSRAAQEAEKRRNAERMERLRRGWNHDQRGRGRGGYMGDRRHAGAAAVSGPLSQGFVEGKVKHHVPHRKAGAVKGEQAKEAATKVKDETVVSSRSGRRRVVVDHEDEDGVEEVSGVKKEGQQDGGYISSDDDDEAFGGPRRDVDHINLLSDDEEDATTQERAFSLAPVRLRRVEHRERGAGISTEPRPATGQKDSTQSVDVEAEGDVELAAVYSKVKGRARTKDVEVVQTTRRWRGVYDDDDEEVQVKEEPMEDVQVTAAAPPAAAADDSGALRSSPEHSRKALKDKAKASGKASFLAKRKPAFQTREEEREWDRWQQDLQTLVEELGHVDVDTEGGLTADSGGVRPKSEAIYLFQFPPVLPNLSTASEAVKTEKTERTAVPSSPQQSKRAAATKSKPPSDSAVVKIEDEVTGTEKSAAPPGPKLASGVMGKLRVHQSGKVTLDWGGTSLQLNMGLDASFLQDAVITKVPAGTGLGGETGEAYALGPVRGKFVVTPDWDAVI